MNILVINAGSSSLKYQLFDMLDEKVLAKGNCERIGIDGSVISHKTCDGRKKEIEVAMKDHTDAFMQVKDVLTDAQVGVITNLNEVEAIGHRVVQGGSRFSESVVIDDEVLSVIEELIPLAPLHNKAHVQAIKACTDVFGTGIPQIAVFDTAFHSTMPEEAYIYPIPYEYYEKYQIRRYGFHGTSHKYVSAECAKAMGRDIKDLKIITCHLGNGSSITAVDRGEVIDTSMGLTPLDGFMMGTRTGTLDPSVVTFLENAENLSPNEMSDLLNKRSGLLGVSGVSSDDRDVTKAAQQGNERAKLAHKILRYEIAKFIGSYFVALGGCDAIVFTAGLGENQYSHREAICEKIKCLGVEIDTAINEETRFGKSGIISTEESKVKVYVIPTNEELVIARDTKEIIEKQ